MELKEHLIGGTFISKGFLLAIVEKNIPLLKKLGADVFKEKAKRTTKYKGIKGDDSN